MLINTRSNKIKKKHLDRIYCLISGGFHEKLNLSEDDLLWGLSLMILKNYVLG